MKYFIALCALAAVASAAQLSGNEPIPILRNIYEAGVEGTFEAAYETGNGISAESKGSLKNAGQKDEAQQITGSFQYTSPEGTPIRVQYVADENGYQPQSDQLPVGPEVPELIIRALKYLADHPYHEESLAKKGH